MALKDAYMYINTNLNIPVKLSEEIEADLIFGCEDLIADLKKDIDEYGKNHVVRLYPDTLGEIVIFDDYRQINDSNQNEYRPHIDLSLQQLLNIYTLQNSLDEIKIEN